MKTLADDGQERLLRPGFFNFYGAICNEDNDICRANGPVVRTRPASDLVSVTNFGVQLKQSFGRRRLCDPGVCVGVLGSSYEIPGGCCDSL